MNKTILIIAAHADDEVIGCGGTIARHVADGDIVHAVFLADGVSSRAGVDKRESAKREAAAATAHKILGIAGTSYCGLPDNRLDSLALLDVVQLLEARIHTLKPEVIYTHHYGDLNVDHRVTHQAVMTACRPIPTQSVREIYTFEVMSSSEWATPGNKPFLPNYYIDISNYLSTKLSALEAYKIEMRDTPHSRNIDHIQHLALHRGQSVGMNAAEAFMIMRVLR
jgi:N-acetylglucosamine malate deacetylase 1